MTLLNKIKWVLGIALIFLLILTTNLIDRQNFMIVRNSIETLYADRLVAKNIIFDISKNIGHKEISYLKLEPVQVAAGVKASNTHINGQITLFTNTKLTPNEKAVFDRFKNSLQNLQEVEMELSAGQKTKSDLAEPLALVREYLDQLAAIQMLEGRRELYESKKAISSADLFTQLEIAVLIVLAIAIQVIIIYTPKSGSEA
ncbi:MAG: hypothetical protein ACI81P_002625 [Neolewinella sp.]|jgi:hypothetical protein